MWENHPDEPFFIWARSPEARDTAIRLAANMAWLDALEEDQFGSALAQYAGHIHGYTLHRQDEGFVSRRFSAGLMSANTLFKGLKRDLIDVDLDKRRHVYILNPVRDYGYESSTKVPRGHVVRPKPVDSVFAAYAQIDDAAVRLAKEWYGEYLPEDTKGVIHRWEWITPLDPSDESLPDGFATRYDERLW